MSAGGDEPTPEKPYKVGFGKPPKATQFQPGHTRSKGPRKRKPSLDDELYCLLSSKITVRQSGQAKRIPMVKALAAKLRSEAIQEGKRWAIELLIAVLQRQSEGSPHSRLGSLLEEDQALLAELAAKLSRSADDN